MREKTDEGDVRNVGKPVELSERYYQEGADEIVFLNITSFRELVLEDQPMLKVLQEASKTIFAPLCVGGGIRSYSTAEQSFSALQVADRYFRAGADKVSIGSDAVVAAKEFMEAGKCPGNTSIEQIAKKYGNQAVVVSVDPKRMYVADKNTIDRPCVKLSDYGMANGPSGEEYVWWCCTAKGGRELTDMDVVQLGTSVEKLGCGELLVNCIDRDGQNTGYEIALLDQLRQCVSIPVIASSGAGKPHHFSEVVHKAKVDATLAAGIFHRREVAISEIKKHMTEAGIEIRSTA